MYVCPKCARVLMDTTKDGLVRVRTRLLLVSDSGDMTGICPQCKTPSKLPLVAVQKPQKSRSAKATVDKQLPMVRGDGS